MHHQVKCLEVFAAVTVDNPANVHTNTTLHTQEKPILSSSTSQQAFQPATGHCLDHARGIQVTHPIEVVFRACSNQFATQTSKIQHHVFRKVVTEIHPQQFSSQDRSWVEAANSQPLDISIAVGGSDKIADAASVRGS